MIFKLKNISHTFVLNRSNKSLVILPRPYINKFNFFLPRQESTGTEMKKANNTKFIHKKTIILLENKMTIKLNFIFMYFFKES